MTTPDVRLGPVDAVRLVAAREVRTRLRSKAFRISTAITLLLLIGFAIVMKFVGGGVDAKVGVVGPATALARPLEASAKAIGETVETRTVQDEQAGRDQVAGGDLDALLVGDGQRIRVVELLLATIRPWQLMAGKVAGIGVVGLIQMAVISVVGVTVGLSIGVLTISASAAFGTVVWLIVWFLLGFVMYSLVFAALAALVSRQEDVGGVITPALMFVILGYVLGISILPSNPGSRLVEVLSVIPMFAPTLMPMRLAMGGV